MVMLEPKREEGTGGLTVWNEDFFIMCSLKKN